jgi:hypothetical protein
MPDNEPHAKRRGWLKNGNPPGDFSTAPRCGAKTRGGPACMAPAMPNGRCRMHGGTSTGPRTEIGLARSMRANWKHGGYSTEAKHQAGPLRQLLRESRELCRSITALCQ